MHVLHPTIASDTLSNPLLGFTCLVYLAFFALFALFSFRFVSLCYSLSILFVWVSFGCVCFSDRFLVVFLFVWMLCVSRFCDALSSLVD